MNYLLRIIMMTFLLACYTGQSSSAGNTNSAQNKVDNVPAGFTANRNSERKYKRKETDALNSQIIRIDGNMDGFIQASEYEKLKTEGTIYGAAPNFSEVSRNGRADYCELETSIELHYARNLKD
jgi:hypothetical protein